MSADMQTHDDVIKWKHFPRYWPLVRGIHRSPVKSPHKDKWRRALMFSLICAWIKCWVNNGEAGDLRRHRVHYDVIVMDSHTIHFWMKKSKMFFSLYVHVSLLKIIIVVIVVLFLTDINSVQMMTFHHSDPNNENLLFVHCPTASAFLVRLAILYHTVAHFIENSSFIAVNS